MNPAELLSEVTTQVRRHHAVLKPFLANTDAIQRASRHLRVEEVGIGKPIVSPMSEDRDLRLLCRGTAAVVIRVGGGLPETVRTMAPPVAIGANAFALGQAHSATVLATASTTLLRAAPKPFRRLSNDTPAVAVALLRWAALDLVEWLREHRMATDDWSVRRGRRAGSERAFDLTQPGREVVDIDPATRRVAEEALDGVRAFQGHSLHPLADGLGTELHLVTVEAGQPIVAHGEIDGNVYLLLDGEAATFGATGQLLARFQAGGGAQEIFIGEVAFLAQGMRDGTVTATTDCLLLQIPRDSVTWMLRNHPNLAVRLHKALLRTLCWRLIEVDEERERLVDKLKGTAVPAPPRRR